MQSAAERQRLNHYLRKHHLGALDDRGLPAQLAFLIDDDAEFSRILNTCEPEERRNCYESLKPNLRFPARPFEDYLTEWREQAEVRQLPVVQPDGKLRAYNVPEIETERMRRNIEASIADSVARYHLILTCRRCTFQEAFPGVNKPEALERARAAGWIHSHGEDSTGYEVCPDCGNGSGA
jgi:hypothetical protein